MTQHDGRARRALRGVALASFAVLIAAMSHVAAGGTIAGPAAIGLAFAVSVPTAVLLAGRAPALWRQALAVAAAQVAYHALFSLLGPASSGAVHRVGHHGVAVDPAALPLHTHGDPVWMPVAHVVAAVATLLLVRFAGAAWAALSVAVRRLARRLAIALPTPGRRAPSIAAPCIRTPSSLRRGMHPRRRGPPVLV